MSRMTWLTLLVALALSASISRADMPELTPGNCYVLTTAMVDGDEQITTLYWASVDDANEKTVTLTNVFWSESVTPLDRLAKKDGVVERLVRGIERGIIRMFPHKKSVAIGFGFPLKDEKLILNREQIATARLVPKQQFEELAEGSRSFYERRPRSLERNMANDQ